MAAIYKKNETSLPDKIAHSPTPNSPIRSNNTNAPSLALNEDPSDYGFGRNYEDIGNVQVLTSSSRGNGNSTSDPHYRTYSSGQQGAAMDIGEYPQPFSREVARAREAFSSESDRSPLFASNVDTSLLGFNTGSGSCLGSCCILSALCCHKTKEICSLLFCEDSFEGRRLRPGCRILIIIAGLCLAFTVGYAYALAFHNAPTRQLVQHRKDYDVLDSGHMLSLMSGDIVKDYLTALTDLGPRLAGFGEDSIDALNYLTSTLSRDAPKFQRVVHNYTRVYLPKPIFKPDPGELCGHVELFKMLDDTRVDVKTSETPCTITYLNKKNAQETFYPFFGYAQEGLLELKNISFVNAATEADYRAILALPTLPNITGTIVIAPLSPDVFPGAVAEMLAKLGVAGALLYPEPSLGYNPSGDRGSTYPNGRFLPEDAVVIGSLRSGDGDPLSPGLPSIDDMYRLDPKSDDVRAISIKIPVHPISFKDAKDFVERAFKVNLAQPEERKKIHLTTGSGYRLTMVTREAVTLNHEIHNVVVTIPGDVEPDRYVMIGAHFDSFSDGAYDSAGGSAALLTITRALHRLYDQFGWRPRRTIILAFWDAHEFGSIGATEFIEQFEPELRERLVAYLDIDEAVAGQDALSPRVHPLLSRVLFDSARLYPQPDPQIRPRTSPPSGAKVFDWMLYRARESSLVEKSETNEDIPIVIPDLGGGDHEAFWDELGIPISHLQFQSSQNARKQPMNPVSHTQYDNLDVADKYTDPGDLPYHSLYAHLHGDLLLRLADSQRLPLSACAFARYLQRLWDGLLADPAALAELDRLQSDSDWSSAKRALEQALTLAIPAAHAFDQLPSPSSILDLRELNDKAMQIPMVFMTSYHIRFRKTRSLLWKVASNVYEVVELPGLRKALGATGEKPDEVHAKRELSSLLLAVKQFISLIRSDILTF